MGNYYKKDDVKYPRVNAIIGQLDKPGLVYWAANCACDYIIGEVENADVLNVPTGALYKTIEGARHNFRKVSGKAKDIGSMVHGAVEHWLKTGEEPDDSIPEVLAGFIAFLEWMDENKIKREDTLETEKTVYHRIPDEHTQEYLRYAGTYDWLVKWDGDVWLIDFKTSKAFYPEYNYQVAAYGQAETVANKLGLLRLDKVTGYPEFKDTTDTYRKDAEVFNTLVKLWYLRKER